MKVRKATVNIKSGAVPKKVFAGLDGLYDIYAMSHSEACTTEQVRYAWGLFGLIEDYTGQNRNSVYDFYLKLCEDGVKPFTLSKMPKNICTWFCKRITKDAYDRHGIVYPEYKEGKKGVQDYFLI